ncbi:dTMP kinase [Desulfococcaceae bacterium OttesenSCG-928-F15]|nr:dTMP kinase [Desulfococcaceae bacterium OttesenSCG-928-F15]
MLITLCGGEGTGKSTQAKRLKDRLEKSGFQVVLTREPGGTAIGAKIRALLLDPENRDMVADTELFLYAADRAQHLAEVVRPALRSGKIVISDRFHDSTTVYQGIARGLDGERIQKVHDLVLGDLRPDLTFLLDLSPEKGLSRAKRQAQNGERPSSELRFEEESLLFHEKIRKGFLDLAAKEKRFLVVDASLAPDLVTEILWDHLSIFMKKKNS